MTRIHHLSFLRTSLIGAVALTSFAVAAPAVADTPPAPAPLPANLADAPLKDSGVWLDWADVHTSTSSSFTLGWRANRATATFEVSRSKPSKVNGSWRFPDVPSFSVVKGVAENSGTGDKLSPGAATYRFNRTVTGLDPNTTYYAIIRIPVGPGEVPVDQAYLRRTTVGNAMPLTAPRTHQVTYRVKSIHVSENGDQVGNGEIRFGTRMAPDADPTIPSLWYSWTHADVFGGYKVKDGQTLNIDGLIGGSGTVTGDRAFIEVQGYEDDAVSKAGCSLQGGKRVGQQGSDKCRDSAVAQVMANLPNGKGTHVQTVTANVYRSPALRFTATIEVTNTVK